MNDLEKNNNELIEQNLARRNFVKSIVGGLVVGFVLPTGGRILNLMGEAEAAQMNSVDIASNATPINAWIRINPAVSGTTLPPANQPIVELMFGGCEMGQGTMTGLAQLLAEELKVGWDQIRIKRPDISAYLDPLTKKLLAYPIDPTTKKSAIIDIITGLPSVTPYSSTYFSNYNAIAPTQYIFPYVTGGSSGIARRWMPLRVAAAQARELLVAAAMQVNIDPDRTKYQTDKGVVTYTSGTTTTSLTYSKLATQVTDLNVLKSFIPYLDDPSQLLTIDPSKFQLIGQRLQRPDIPLKTSGAAKFGIDITNLDMPNVGLKKMVFVVVKHCPTLGGTLLTTPAAPTGALKIIPLKAFATRGAVLKDTVNAVAVAADNTWKAKNLVNALKVTWKLPVNTASVNSATINTIAQQRLAISIPGTIPTWPVWQTEPPTAALYSGSLPPLESTILSALDGITATKKIDATFSLPYVAHATMEVLNCTAVIYPDTTTILKCEIWAPTQNASSVIQTALTTLGWTDPARVIVHTTFLGGGLGRKIEQDYISQAVQAANAMPNTPVKLTWMREQDFANDQYRPMALINVKAGLDASNNIAAWFYRTVTPSISLQRGAASNKLDSQAVEGATGLPYALGNFITEWVPLEDTVAGIPVGYWRSVGCSINTFAVESVIDMLAAAANQDPFDFRRQLISDPKILAVLEAANTLSTWRLTIPANHAWGMAISKAFNTIVCEIIEISQPVLGSLVVHRVDCVIDCGIAINPDAIEAQMEGGIIHGLNATLWGQTTFVNGVAQQTNFNKARMMRVGEAPTIRVKIMPSTNDPSGAGEPGVPPIAPAVANAYAKLSTGRRITSLPFFPGALMGGL